MNNIANSTLPLRKTFFCIYLLFITLTGYAQLPSGFIDAKLQSGYTSPMGVVFSKNGQKMFVWEKKGKLWVSNWNGSTYIKQSSAVLDITEEVGDWGDFGFESVALDPDFDSNGLIYLFYQVDRHHLLKFGTSEYSATTNDYFNATISRLTRYKVSTSGSTLTADNGSRKILLGESKSTGVPATHQSHAGGQIIFGTDGTLFVTTGDNASFSGVDAGSKSDTYFQQALDDGIMRSTENVGSLRSQLINSFCGKLLRMDPNTGNGISSNPYYDSSNPRSAKSRVWALGFRNPYRATFKTGTGSTNPSEGNPGTLLVGDVGNGSWEEVNIIEKGGVNCGWPLYEGIDPVFAFLDLGTLNQEESGNPTFASLCVQAGKANINNPNATNRRLAHFPPALDWKHGQDLARYPDFTKGNIVSTETIGSSGAQTLGTPFKGACVTSGTYYTGSAFPSNFQKVYFFADYESNWIKAAVIRDNNNHQISEVKSFAPAGYGKGIVDIEYCPLDGSIVYVNISTGDIQKISYGSTNRPPIAAISANKTSGSSPLSVTFSSSGSSDPDGNTLSYEWNFGDGTTTSSANPSHTFTSSSSKGFTVTLTVKDGKGLSDSKSIVISINNTAPSVKITTPTNNSKYTLTGPTSYSLKATVTDNDAAGMLYAWQVTLRHNTHEHREPVVTNSNPTVLISPVGCDGEDYYYLISLTVTDKGGLTAKDEVKIVPDCNSQSLNVTNLSATAQNAAVALGWTNSSLAFDELMVVAKAGSGFTNSPSGSSYTANASFTGNGSSFDGGKVVYKGKATSMTVTSLTNGSKYYFRVYVRKGTTWTGGIEKSATPAGSTTKIASLFDATKCYRFMARHSGKVMETASSSTDNGVKAQQNSWSGTKMQVWRIKPIDGTYYRILNGNSGKALDVKGAFTADGTFLQQYNNNGGANQQFKFEASSSYYFISARHSGKYLDVSGSSTANGAGIVQMPKKGTNNQQWTVSSVSCPTGTVALLASQIYTADGYREGRKGILTWVSNASDADYFTIEKLDKNGDFETLDVVNAKLLDDNIDKNYYSYTDNQTFDGENTYRITLTTDNAAPQYSNLISLNFKAAIDFAVFPNPTSDYVDVDLKLYEDRPVVLTVIDLKGQTVRSVSFEKANKTQRVDLDGLSNGQYLLRIHTATKRDVTRLFNITR
jgi:glucose/arabinose dehydrogenase